jgi:DNA relaxase NicK
VRDETGSEVGAVAYGGKQGERIMIEVKGERTPGVVEHIRNAAPHRCTRVDACADFDAPGSFSRLLRHCLAVKKGHHLWGDRRGDWEDHPERGRTQYLGATSSPVRARLYEKGLQPEYLHLARHDWVRLELQVRPAKEAKEAFAKLSAVEVWGASKWSRDLAALALQEHVDPHPAGTVYRLTSQDHKLRWMCRQYGGALMQLADDCGGWDVAGLTLRDVLAEVQRDDKRTRRR